ncbi:hypothetical protein ACLOJK_010587 [Asimina triloba]
MASKKKEAEGIALLSMYNDEDMDPDEDDSENGDEVEDEFAQDKDSHRNIEPFDTRNEEKFNSDSAPETTPPLAQPPTPVLAADEATVKSPAPPTPQPQITVYSPAPLQVLVSNPLDVPRARKLPLGIVDYAHDETAMSPEAEEGEILNSGLVTLGSEAQIATGRFVLLHQSQFVGNLPEKTPPGTVHVLTPNIQATPPQPLELPAEQQEQSKSDNSAIMNDTRTGLESTQMEVDVELSVEVEKENVDPLEKFLPPPPKIKCPEELQKKINKFLEYKKAGKSFNADLRNRKDYRNPDFLLHAVRYQDIDQIGTCFSKDVFDPHGYDKSDYYDEIGHQHFLFVSVSCIVCIVISGIFYAFVLEGFTFKGCWNMSGQYLSSVTMCRYKWYQSHPPTVQEREYVQQGRRSPRGVDCDIPHYPGGEKGRGGGDLKLVEAPFVRVVWATTTRDKTMKGVMIQSGQYLSSVAMSRYKLRYCLLRTITVLTEPPLGNVGYHNPSPLGFSVLAGHTPVLGLLGTHQLPPGSSPNHTYSNVVRGIIGPRTTPEADMKREMERKEQERKKAQKVDFVSGGTQPGIIGPAPKISAQIPVATVSSVAAGLQSVPTAADAPRDGRQNKKTKWDKVDGDKRPLHSGGQEALSAASAHAALLTAANAGAGYTAFAQQKRREAEEKRSSEKKFQRS